MRPCIHQEILLDRDEVIVSSASPLPAGKVSTRVLGINRSIFSLEIKDGISVSMFTEISLGKKQHMNSSVKAQEGGDAL